MLKKLSMLVVGSMQVFAMHSVELNINQLDLEVEAKIDVGQINYSVRPNTIFIGFKILNGDVDNSSSNTIRSSTQDTNSNLYQEASFLMKRQIGKTRLALGMGIKVNHTDNFTSVPLGLEMTYRIPSRGFIPMYLNGSAYYATRSLSFEKGISYLEYRASYDFAIIKNGRVLIGYRNMSTNFSKNRTDIYNRSVFVGFKFAF